MTGPISLPRARGCLFDPPDAYHALTESAALHPLRFPLADDGWIVTQHAAAKVVLGDSRFSHRNELIASPLPPPFPLPPGTPISPPPAEPGAFNKMDPPEHTRYRRLVGGWFSARAAERLIPAIEDTARELLAAMVEHGAPADLVRLYARPLPARVIFDFLEVPEDIREPLHNSLDVLMRLRMSLEELIEAVTVATELLDELARGKMTEHGGGMLGELAQRGLDVLEVRNVAWALLGGGTDTTANMIGLGVISLLEHPDQLESLRNKPELLDNAIEELLRYLTISQFGASRTATEDLEVFGHPVRAGQTVVVALPAVNRDPRVFPEPDRLDLARSTRGHLAFGYGVHKCIGQYLARATLRVAYPALFERFPELRLAVPLHQLAMRDDMDHYGVHEIPVRW
ncbi:MAG: cytochrome P450 [Pseudonocardia sp.]|nr:cytochrome P450 [Pseudonocardia sp.]